MHELEFDPEAEGETNGDGAAPTVVDLPTGSGSARLRLPPGADDDEVAALVAAVATRLAAADEADSTDPEESNRWRLAGRLGARRRYELPRQCRQGGEWRAASRRP